MHKGPSKNGKKASKINHAKQGMTQMSDKQKRAEKAVLEMLENMQQEQNSPGYEVHIDIQDELAQLEQFLMNTNQVLENLLTTSHLELAEDFISPVPHKDEKLSEKSKDKEKEKEIKESQNMRKNDEHKFHHFAAPHQDEKLQTWVNLLQGKVGEVKDKLESMRDCQSNDSSAKEKRSQEAMEKLRDITRQRSERRKKQEQREQAMNQELELKAHNCVHSVPQDIQDEAKKYLLQQLEDKLTQPLKPLEDAISTAARVADLSDDVMGEVMGRTTNYIKTGKAEMPLTKRLDQLSTYAQNVAEDIASNLFDIEIHEHPQTYTQSVKRVGGALKEGDLQKAYKQGTGFLKVKAKALDETLSELQDAIFTASQPLKQKSSSMPVLPSQARVRSAGLKKHPQSTSDIHSYVKNRW
jgi:hypothetical protein